MFEDLCKIRYSIRVKSMKNQIRFFRSFHKKMIVNFTNVIYNIFGINVTERGKIL